jgi:hypothetical protein
VHCELELPPPLGHGLFALSLAVGILAHASEETTGPTRPKGPVPPTRVMVVSAAIVTNLVA